MFFESIIFRLHYYKLWSQCMLPINIRLEYHSFYLYIKHIIYCIYNIYVLCLLMQIRIFHRPNYNNIIECIDSRAISSMISWLDNRIICLISFLSNRNSNTSHIAKWNCLYLSNCAWVFLYIQFQFVKWYFPAQVVILKPVLGIRTE